MASQNTRESLSLSGNASHDPSHGPSRPLALPDDHLAADLDNSLHISSSDPFVPSFPITSHADYGFPTSTVPATPSPDWINRLPSEILSSIFRMVLPESPFYCLSFMLVCQRWNLIIMTDALLWSVIHVNFGDGRNPARISAFAQYVAAALVRSRGVPLDITLNFSSLFAYDVAEYVSPPEDPELIIESTLVCVDYIRGQADSVASRWDTLVVFLPFGDDDYAKKITDRFAGSQAPNLRYLIIERNTMQMGIDDTTLFTLGPQLQHLCASCVDLRQMKIVPNCLQYLHVAVDGNWEAALPVLAQTSLRHLKLENSCDFRYSLEEDSPGGFLNPSSSKFPLWKGWMDRELRSRFEYLETLHVAGYFSPDMLAFMELPALRILLLNGEHPLAIFSRNKTFFPSVEKIVIRPPRRIVAYTNINSPLFNPGFVVQLRMIGEYSLPSLYTISMPKCCVPIAYPSLATVVAEFPEVNPAQQFPIFIRRNGI